MQLTVNINVYGAVAVNIVRTLPIQETIQVKCVRSGAIYFIIVGSMVNIEDCPSLKLFIVYLTAIFIVARIAIVHIYTITAPIQEDAIMIIKLYYIPQLGFSVCSNSTVRPIASKYVIKYISCKRIALPSRTTYSLANFCSAQYAGVWFVSNL